jgi:hypothetical protein
VLASAFAIAVDFAMAVELLADVHGDAFRCLCTRMDKDFVGLTVASRHARRAGLITQTMAKKLERLDSAFSVVRHLSRPKVNCFLMDLKDMIALMPPEIAIAPSSSDEGSIATADSEFSSDVALPRVPHVHIGERNASTQTNLTMENTVVTASAEDLVLASLAAAGRALAERVECAAQAIQAALHETAAHCEDQHLSVLSVSDVDLVAVLLPAHSDVDIGFNHVFFENGLAALRREIKCMHQSVLCVSPPPVSVMLAPDGGCALWGFDVEVGIPADFRFDLGACSRAQVAVSALAREWCDFEKHIKALAQLQHEDDKDGNTWWSSELQIAEDIAAEVDALLPVVGSGFISHQVLVASLVARIRGCSEGVAQGYINDLGINFRNGKVAVFAWALAKACHEVDP